MPSSKPRRIRIHSTINVAWMLMFVVAPCGCRVPLQAPQSGEGAFASQDLPAHLSAKHPSTARQSTTESPSKSDDALAADSTESSEPAAIGDEVKLAAADEAQDARTPLNSRLSPTNRKQKNTVAVTQKLSDTTTDASDESGVTISFSDRPDAEDPSQSKQMLADQKSAAPTEDLAQQTVAETPQQPAGAGPQAEAAAVVFAADSSQPAPTTEATADDSLQVLAEQLRDRLQTAADAAESPEERIDLAKKQRLLSLILEDLQAAQQPIEELAPAAQDYIAATLLSLHEATDKTVNPIENRRFTRALKSHRLAAEHLAQLANLELLNAAFCTEVESFGLVTRFADYQFQAGQQVLLYCEIENFVSRKSPDGYETKLQGNYEIIDAHGRRVIDQLLPEDTDVCGNQRHDFYIAYRLSMPRDIEPGKYALHLVIEDMHGRKIGQTKLDFQISQ